MENISMKKLKKTLSESFFTPSERDQILESLDDAFKILAYAHRELNRYSDVYEVSKAKSNIAFATSYIEKAKRALL